MCACVPCMHVYALHVYLMTTKGMEHPGTLELETVVLLILRFTRERPVPQSWAKLKQVFIKIVYTN